MPGSSARATTKTAVRCSCTDGDEGIWRGRYDAWDRVYQEELSTGAVLRRHFDEAGNPTQETMWTADPTTTPDAELLSDVRWQFTSFGQVERVVEVLSVDEVSGTEELRITEQDFDAAGRATATWSGPPVPGTELLDRSQARREAELTYEREGGRVLVESAGGLHGEPALYTYTYGYHAENRAPWADEVTFAESVPGETELVDTFTVSYARDALGRPVREQSSDGRVLDTAYDRFGGPIQVRSGAGATTSIGLDGRGLPVRQIRPNNRGGTTYAYDFDGRLLRQSTESAGGETWERLYGYDATGRVVRIDHEDGTFVGATYNPDGTMATRTTREGLQIDLQLRRGQPLAERGAVAGVGLVAGEPGGARRR